METREQLLKELAEWTVKYVEADKGLKTLLPTWANLSKGEELQQFIPTKESLAEYSKAVDEVKATLTKQREILDKLSELR